MYDDGSLHAIGTADDPILLTGVEKTRGSWGGLRFYQSNSVENELAYVTIEYGGGYWDANVTLNGSSGAPARVRISSCDLQLSATYGFQFNAYSILDDFSANRITENALGAGRIAARAAGNLKEDNSYSGNDIDVVVIEGGTVDTDQTWPGIDAYYLNESAQTHTVSGTPTVNYSIIQAELTTTRPCSANYVEYANCCDSPSAPQREMAKAHYLVMCCF